MKKSEFKNLNTGDIVRGKVTGNVYIVTSNYGDHITAVQTVDLTNPDDWDLVIKQSK